MPQTPTTKREHRAAYQALSARYADRYAEPWTPEDDRIVLDTTAGTTLERAIRLQRTYFACTNRQNALRARLRP